MSCRPVFITVIPASEPESQEILKRVQDDVRGKSSPHPTKKISFFLVDFYCFLTKNVL